MKKQGSDLTKGRPLGNDLQSFLKWIKTMTPPQCIMALYDMNRKVNEMKEVIESSKGLLGWTEMQPLGTEVSPEAQKLWNAISEYESQYITEGTTIQ